MVPAALVDVDHVGDVEAGNLPDFSKESGAQQPQDVVTKGLIICARFFV